MKLAYFVSPDPAVRWEIEQNARALARAHNVDFVCAVDETWRPAGPYVARASDDLLLVLEHVEL